ncbi:MAG: hypothetical protein ACOCV2_00995 [Persicimonas sp.]
MYADQMLDEEQLDRAHTVAESVRAELNFDEALRPYESLCHDGRTVDGAQLHLEDVTGIPFVSQVSGVEEYQHRARVRADTEDMFAAVTTPVDGYESYCRERLDLGQPELLQVEPTGGPMAIASACREPANLARIADFATQSDGLVIHPYMAIEPVWELASELAERGVDVEVLGPPPPILWLANDKGRLARLVDRLTDGAWNVQTHLEDQPDRMVDRLVELAEGYDLVGLKRTRCASAMGNIVFEAPTIKSAGRAALGRQVRAFLDHTEWEDGEPVLAVEWADTDLSPSTQMWIPAPEVGPVRLDGVYQQILSGTERVFVGSRPSTLPKPVEHELIEASFMMGTVFQKLGYVGRCSFDFIVVGDPHEDWSVCMTECNGRWGGTSTPMHLVDRLADGPRPWYVAQDFVHPELKGRRFLDVLEAVGAELYDATTGEGRFVFYNPGPLNEHGKIDVIALGESPEKARSAVEQTLPRLLDLEPRR